VRGSGNRSDPGRGLRWRRWEHRVVGLFGLGIQLVPQLPAAARRETADLASIGRSGVWRWLRGGFGGPPSTGSSAFQKAIQACASLRPSGGFGGGFGGGTGGFGGFASALKAFRSCMAAHGEPVPTTRPTSPPAAGSSPADRFLNGLNPSNSRVAAALKGCESKLSSFLNGSGQATSD
jgi:hypothetical protein